MNATAIPNTTPQEQFRTDVLPPYQFYLRDKGREWKARCAANAVAYFAEHVHKYYKHYDRSQLHGKTGKAENFVKFLAETYDVPELVIVWDFALVNKHRFSSEEVKPRVATAERNVYIDTGSGITSATGVFSKRLVAGSMDALVAEADSGHLWMPDCGRYFDDVIEMAVDFWKGRLPSMPTYS